MLNGGTPVTVDHTCRYCCHRRAARREVAQLAPRSADAKVPISQRNWGLLRLLALDRVRTQGGQDAPELMAFVLGQAGHQPELGCAHTVVGAF